MNLMGRASSPRPATKRKGRAVRRGGRARSALRARRELRGEAVKPFTKPER